MVRRALVPALGFLALAWLPLVAAGCGNSPSTYGSRRYNSIPANTTLVFDIDLVKVE
jgi:hypothetical protein